jgi:hypothetical protein
MIDHGIDQNKVEKAASALLRCMARSDYERGYEHMQSEIHGLITVRLMGAVEAEDWADVLARLEYLQELAGNLHLRKQWLDGKKKLLALAAMTAGRDYRGD